jgi:hypothetical protein
MNNITAELIHALAVNCHPRTIVMTGSGEASRPEMNLIEALREWDQGGKIHLIIKDDSALSDFVRESPYTEIHIGDSEEILPKLLLKIGKVDIAFLNTWQRMALMEFRMCHPFIREGGLAIFHGTQKLNTGKTLYSICRQAMDNIYEFILFCGTKEGDGNFFGNSDDNGLFVARKMEGDPFLNLPDRGTDEHEEELFDLDNK